MTPAQMIAMLDRQLADKGQTIVLRRRVGTTNTWNEVTLRGRLFGHVQNELLGSTKQTMQSFILSPTLLNAAVTAGTWPPTAGDIDPKKGDELRGADGISRRIESISSQRPGDVVVRYDGQVLGCMARDRFSTFARDLQMATASIAPEAINRELAKFAKSALADAIASREASEIYTRYVSTGPGSSVEGAPEEAVRAPGPILYVFSYWEPILAFAYAELAKNSPRKTGRYIDSQVTMVGGQLLSPGAQIAADEEVVIVATQPYSRKIEVGHMKMSVPDGVFQRVRRKVQSQFGLAVDVRFRMMHIPGGYTLRGRFRRGYKEFARKQLQRDTQAGAKMTYPAIVMKMKGY